MKKNSKFGHTRKLDVSQNPLKKFIDNYQGPMSTKWDNYFDVYHRHFSVFRNTAPVIVEFGVKDGGSLFMWRDYFGKDSRICGVDINPSCKQLEKDGFEIFVGDQANKDFLQLVKSAVGPIDVLIDDGGHTMEQQINTFEELYGLVKCPGIYLVEDVHTSYWRRRYGGGLRRRGTFIEHTKKLIDQMNAWHISSKANLVHIGKDVKVDSFTRSTYSMTYYQSMVVFEKRQVEKQILSRAGK